MRSPDVRTNAAGDATSEKFKQEVEDVLLGGASAASTGGHLAKREDGAHGSMTPAEEAERAEEAILARGAASGAGGRGGAAIGASCVLASAVAYAAIAA